MSEPASNTFPLEDIAVPTLLVHAADDRLAPYEHVPVAAARIPNLHLVTIPAGGHLFLQHQAEVRRATTTFVREIRPATHARANGRATRARPAQNARDTAPAAGVRVPRPNIPGRRVLYRRLADARYVLPRVHDDPLQFAGSAARSGAFRSGIIARSDGANRPIDTCRYRAERGRRQHERYACQGLGRVSADRSLIGQPESSVRSTRRDGHPSTTGSGQGPTPLNRKSQWSLPCMMV